MRIVSRRWRRGSSDNAAWFRRRPARSAASTGPARGSARSHSCRPCLSLIKGARAASVGRRSGSVLQHGAAWLLFICNEWMHEQIARRSNAGMKTALERAVARLLSSCECEDISTRCKGYREGRHTCYPHQRPIQDACRTHGTRRSNTSSIGRRQRGPRLDAPLETHTLR